MKILHVCQRDDPETGGSFRVCEALAREQRKAGLEVWILFLYGAPAALSNEFHPNSVGLGLASSRQALQGVGALRKAIKRIKPDIIHSHDGILWPRLVYLKRAFPVVMHTHLPPTEQVNLKEKLGQPLTKMTTDCMIGISQHTINEWVGVGFKSNAIHLVPNGVDFNRFSPVNENEKVALKQELNLPADRKTMLWVGRLHNATKGIDRLEKVAAALPDTITLAVVGMGPEYDGMIDRCQELIEHKRLVMIGSSSVPERYYKAADCFLFSSYQDAFGLVILEAVACELPILTFPLTKGGGADALINEFSTVKLQDGFTGEELEAALEKTNDAKLQMTALREKALDKYSWKALSKKVTEIYELTLKRSGTPQ